MTSEIPRLRKALEQRKGRKQELEDSIEKLKSQRIDAKRSLRQYEQAREIIREVGLKTQEQLSFQISDITTLALEAVLEEPYELLAEFVERRNKTECDLLFQRNDQKVDPLSASGGGAVDVCAFALRIASWSMQMPRSRNVLILDEPMRFVSRDLQEKASMMIKEISEKLGIQFIIITHEPTLTSYADRVFEVKNKNGISTVTNMGEP